MLDSVIELLKTLTPEQLVELKHRVDGELELCPVYWDEPVDGCQGRFCCR